ncbi:hypothetical protein [Devosia sp. RR2S18]|uniref:hypothetical protein n=1 Tax=Devosia rhizosphaerae TaxID=3049774 RepID=UPI002541235C|nr:hypothetical protein [Devosia sp. RR2S18]WIJ25967.1 hypothetical protein QOV41_04155 [Devosia sp. RR2S18]
MAEEKTKQQNEPQSPADRATKLQWVIAAVSSVLVLLLVGSLVLDAITQSGGEPVLRAQVMSVNEDRDGYAVVEVRNDGRATAASVEIEGIAGPLRARAVLDYSPAHSTQEVTLVFPEAVAPDQVEVRILGFAEP